MGRPRTDEEQRFHDGGQGTKRQEKRRERARLWARGEFVPAWKKAMSTSGASSSTQVDWAGMLNRHLDPMPVPSTPEWGVPPPQVEEVEWPQGPGERPPAEQEDVEEDHTSCSLSSVGDFDVEDGEDEAVAGEDPQPPPWSFRGGGVEDKAAGEDRPQPPTWTMQQWKDWEDWENAGEPDTEDGAFMQLSMSEEGEIHNLGIYDEGRRELRGLLRDLSQLENMDEGPEGRWALRAWLTRWRHILGVLQYLTDILERRLLPHPGCSLPTVREPRVAAQRTRLLGLAGHLTSILLGVANDLVQYHQRLSARLPAGVRLPPRPAPLRRGDPRGRPERSRSREEEEEDEGTAFVQTFNMEEWQGLVDHGILGADIGEVDRWLGELAVSVGDRNVPSHVRAQHMWSLGVFTRALRGAIRTMTFVVSTLERREVEGGMHMPAEDDARARVLSGCYRPAMMVASIFHQAVRNGVDDAFTHPESLPPRLQVRTRPPRRDPGRMSTAMMTPRSVPVADELRDGEDGRGRDRTPRMAQAHAMRGENLMAEVAASSDTAPGEVHNQPDDEDSDDSGVSWHPGTTTSTTLSSSLATSTTSVSTMALGSSSSLTSRTEVACVQSTSASGSTSTMGPAGAVLAAGEGNEESAEDDEVNCPPGSMCAATWTTPMSTALATGEGDEESAGDDGVNCPLGSSCVATWATSGSTATSWMTSTSTTTSAVSTTSLWVVPGVLSDP